MYLGDYDLYDFEDDQSLLGLGAGKAQKLKANRRAKLRTRSKGFDINKIMSDRLKKTVGKVGTQLGKKFLSKKPTMKKVVVKATTKKEAPKALVPITKKTAAKVIETKEIQTSKKKGNLILAGAAIAGAYFLFKKK